MGNPGFSVLSEDGIQLRTIEVMYVNRVDIVALLVMLVLSAAMILFGDWRFGTSVMIASVCVFLFVRYRSRRHDRW